MPPTALSPELSHALVPPCARAWVGSTKTANSYSSYSSLQKAKPVSPRSTFLPRDSHLNSSPICMGEKPRVAERLDGTWAVSDLKGGANSHKRSTEEYNVLVGATLVSHGKSTAMQQKSLGFPKTATFLNPSTFYWFFQSLPLKGEGSFRVVILMGKHQVLPLTRNRVAVVKLVSDGSVRKDIDWTRPVLFKRGHYWMLCVFYLWVMCPW